MYDTCKTSQYFVSSGCGKHSAGEQRREAISLRFLPLMLFGTCRGGGDHRAVHSAGSETGKIRKRRTNKPARYEQEEKKPTAGTNTQHTACLLHGADAVAGDRVCGGAETGASCIEPGRSVRTPPGA